MKHVSFFFLLAVSSLSLSACGNTHIKDDCWAYGTSWVFHLFDGNQENVDALKEVALSTSRAHDLEAEGYAKGIAKINKDGEADVDPFLADELKLGVELSEKTNGYFSLFTGELKALWLNRLAKGNLPNDQDIQKAVNDIKETHLEIEGTHVKKIGPAKLDLGGLGKGYCLELLKKEIEDADLKQYVISGGSSSLLLGENPNREDKCTIVELEDLSGTSFLAKNESLSTSSAMKQLYTVEDKRYSHIVNPITGEAEAVLDAVCLRGQNAAVLDALSTAIYCEGIDSIPRYEEEFDIKALAIKNGKVIFHSDGFVLEE